MIDSYSFGSITIDGKTYTKDLIIYSCEVRDNWWRKEGHSLCPEDISEVINKKPEILIVGCGELGVLKVPESTRKYIESKGIKLIAKNTKEASSEYNRLCKTKNVIACMHLTC